MLGMISSWKDRKPRLGRCDDLQRVDQIVGVILAKWLVTSGTRRDGEAGVSEEAKVEDLLEGDH